MAAYLVTTKNSDGTISERLVEARTGSQAVNFVVDGNVTAKTLNTGDLIKHINQGLKIETVPAEKPAAKTEAATTETYSSETEKKSAFSVPAEEVVKQHEKKTGLFQKKSA